MGVLLLPSEHFASEMECDLEGRIEVMADDGLADSPDCVDASAVAQSIRETYGKPYPATLELSDAETQQAYIALENMLELAERGIDEQEYNTAIQQLEAQGYPWGIGAVRENSPVVVQDGCTDFDENIFDFFRSRLGVVPKDESLRDLPRDSNCGRDCEKAIEAAKAFIDAINMAFGADERVAVIREIANDVVQVYWRG